MYWLSKKLALPRNVFHRDELLTSSLVRSDNLRLRSSPGLIREALSKICSELWLMVRRENIGSKYFEFFGSFGAKVAQEISFRNSLQTIFPWGDFFGLGAFHRPLFPYLGFTLSSKRRTWIGRSGSFVVSTIASGLRVTRSNPALRENSKINNKGN